jgi:hypothetical protein
MGMGSFLSSTVSKLSVELFEKLAFYSAQYKPSQAE